MEKIRNHETHRYCCVRNGGNYPYMKALLVELEDLAAYCVLYLDRVFSRGDWNRYDYFHEKIRDHELYRYSTDKTYGFHRMNCSAIAHVFRMDWDMIEAIVELSENELFFHDEFGEYTNPFTDLCLFREDGRLLAGTCSHEQELDIYLTEEEEANMYFPFELVQCDNLYSDYGYTAKLHCKTDEQGVDVYEVEFLQMFQQ